MQGALASSESHEQVDLFSETDVHMFLSAVDLRMCVRVILAGGVSEVLAQGVQSRHGRKLWFPEGACPSVVDQLKPSWYKWMGLKSPVDWVFLCSPVHLRELSLGIAVEFARKGVALMVHKSALSNHNSCMQQLLRSYRAADRLVFIVSSLSTAAWIVVFSSPAVRASMLSVQGRPPAEWVVM